VNSRPSRKIIDSRTVSSSGYLTGRRQRGGWQPVEQVIGDEFPAPVSHPATSR
jgi:hypothetical protein